MRRILQLSDIHFYCCNIAYDPHHVMRKEMIKDLSDYVSRNGKIDHLFICGDIAYKGIKDEYDKAALFIEEICSTICCKPSEVYIVPGNHDKNRNQSPKLIREVFHKALLNDTDQENLFNEILKSDDQLLKTMLLPFRDYAVFAEPYLSIDSLMKKMLTDEVKYDERADSLYWDATLGSLDKGYNLNVYGINTAFCSDKDDFDGNEGHKLFVSKLAYNIPEQESNVINILIAHHPKYFLSSDGVMHNTIDKKFQIQMYGHVHLQSSDNNNAIHLYSGALQPHGDSAGLKYFPVYNIIEVDVISGENNEDVLSVNLLAQKWNTSKFAFEEFSKESKHHSLKLSRANRWGHTPKIESILPKDVSERDILLTFNKDRNRKIVINNVYPGFYDDSVSLYDNCLKFIDRVRKENNWILLWNKIKN